MDTKRMNSHFGTDRISHLPCNVIDEILKYLPLIEAVRTSILSRSWRYNWLTIPYLIFDQRFAQSLHGNYNIQTIIYEVLLLHKGPIIKFTYWVYDDLNSHTLLHFLSHSHVEELTLRFSSSDIHQKLPYHLFTFNHLRDLKLVNCELEAPSSFKGFGRLVKLSLDSVFTTNAELTKFISKCPMIEHLFIIDCSRDTTLEDFEIEAPNLKSFRFFFRGKLSSICFRNTSFLREVSITLCRLERSKGSQNYLVEFFSPLPSIKTLELNCYDFLEVLAGGGVPHELPYKLIHLNVLELSYVDFLVVGQVSSIVCLIRSSPNLQCLEITSRTNRARHVKPAAQFMKEQQKIKLALSHLHHVKIDTFSGSTPEIKFVKLLLSSATELIQLKLIFCKRIKRGTKRESQMLKQLDRLAPVSSKAEIIRKRQI